MKGQEIFRFVYIDSPNAPQQKIQVGRNPSPLYDEMSLNLDQGRTLVLQLAKDYLEEGGFDPDLLKTPLAKQLKALASLFQAHKREELSRLEPDVVAIFGQSSAQVAVDDDFIEMKTKLQDGILALKFQPEKHPKSLFLYTELFEACELIDLLAEGGENLSLKLDQDIMVGHLILPENLFPLPPDELTASGNDPNPAAARKEEIQRLEGKLKKIEKATYELVELKKPDFIRVPPEGARLVEPEDPQKTGSKVLTTKTSSSASARLLLPNEKEIERLNDAEERYGSKLLVNTDRLAKFKLPTKEILEEMELDLGKEPLTYALIRLDDEANFVMREIAELKLLDESLPGLMHIGGSRIPGSFLAIEEDDNTSPFVGGIADEFVIEGQYAHIRPAGVGNLLVTRQHILRYEAGEIAHMENVMQGETKERETRRLRRTEESIVRESETTKEEERDLQSTERLEMRQEVENTVKENSKWSIGAEVSGGYGPFIQASVNTEYSTENSSESITRNASNYSREVTEKTATRISERIREEQTLKTLQEFEEKIRHSLDASEADDHIVGMFRWVDKVYEAQVFDYGSRVFFDIMVPEPAKILLYSQMKTALKSQNTFSPPDPINFRPKDLTAHNYHGYVKKYQAKGVQALPPVMVTVSEVMEGAFQEEPTGDHYPQMLDTLKINLPTGYKAIEAHVGVNMVDGIKPKGGIPFSTTVTVGHNRQYFEDVDQAPKGPTTQRYYVLSQQYGSLTASIITDNVFAYTVTMEIRCIRTNHAFQEWQMETYDALMSAYQKQLAEYNEKIAQQSASQGVSFGGRNPLINRRIERNELKRAAIGMFTEQNFNDFNAYKTTVPVPTIDFEKARKKGRFARFFEQAFEWENMVYELLPYYWGNRNKWVDTLQIQDVDPLHEEFLKSGFARIRVPVRPDFEAAVFHYLDTGKIWNGEEPPRVTNTKHLPFLYDVLARRHEEGLGLEIPIGEPWQYTLPTTLVRVEDGSVLPEWTRDEDGNWIPVEQAEEEPIEP